MNLKYPSSYLTKPQLIQLISQATGQPPKPELQSLTRRALIKELLNLPEITLQQHLSAKTLHYLKYPRQAKKLPVFLTREELRKLLAAAKTARDEMLILFMYHTGCRPGELSQVKVEHCNFENNTVTIIRGKGGKDRTAQLTDPEFIKLLRTFIGSRKAGPLFTSNWQKPYTVRGLEKKFKTMAVRAGLNPAKVTPHKLRHSHAVHSIERGVSLASIRDQLGHSSLAITDIYSRISDQMRKKDYEQHSPFQLKNQAEENKEKPRFCGSCGQQIPKEARFCTSCGAKR